MRTPVKLRTIYTILLLSLAATPVFGQFNLHSSANPADAGVAFALTTDNLIPLGGINPKNVLFRMNGDFLAFGHTNDSGIATVTGLTAKPGVTVYTACWVSQFPNGVEYACSSPFNQTVNRINTTTAVASSSSPSNVGQAVTFTANLSFPAVLAGQFFPSGTVSFFADGSAAALGTVDLAGTASAALTVSNLAAGQHSVVAKFSGDTNFVPSTSAAITQNVNAAVSLTATNLTSSKNPSPPTPSASPSATTTRLTSSIPSAPAKTPLPPSKPATAPSASATSASCPCA